MCQVITLQGGSRHLNLYWAEGFRHHWCLFFCVMIYTYKLLQVFPQKASEENTSAQWAILITICGLFANSSRAWNSALFKFLYLLTLIDCLLISCLIVFWKTSKAPWLYLKWSNLLLFTNFFSWKGASSSSEDWNISSLELSESKELSSGSFCSDCDFLFS